jgi:hypothetical protein
MDTIKKVFLIALIIFIYQNGFAQNCESVLWNLNRSDSVENFSFSALNKLPQIIKWQNGEALSFNGIDEAVLVNANPLQDTDEFTIEAIIKPDSTFNPANYEQRFIHIRNGANDDRRILLELRLYPNQTWAFDTFIKSENSRRTLIDTTKKHSADKWYNVALIYKNGIMTSFVDGIKEAEGNVDYKMIIDGKISIGARQDPRNWFKGAISKIRFTKCALDPKDFLTR